MKTIIEIPDAVIDSLDKIGERTQRSRDSLISEAIDKYVHGNSEETHCEAFGIWKSKKRDGVEYQVSLREEWRDR